MTLSLSQGVLGGGALIFPVVILLIAFHWGYRRKIEEKDKRKVSDKFEKLDASCLEYLQQVIMVPGWRRETIVALSVSAVLLPLAYVVASAKSQIVLRYATLFTLTFVVSMMVMEGSRGYYNYHVLCARTCFEKREDSES